ncbi:MAG: anaerobic ribonucleoside-triphosphate reductase [Holosporales bacterium]|jgi:anaerobic ribonucleoside-triphosphate reductase|nr:anaerobic ribonucleoside-triphosphate reductase [Holosporales bacterium]
MSMNEEKLNDEERTACEVWTRVMGYYRPVAAFNKGKHSEYVDRKCFKEKPCCCEADQ